LDYRPFSWGQLGAGFSLQLTHLIYKVWEELGDILDKARVSRRVDEEIRDMFTDSRTLLSLDEILGETCMHILELGRYRIGPA
jgi:hypothetical protein